MLMLWREMKLKKFHLISNEISRFNMYNKLT